MELLGPVNPREIPEIIAAIESEGGSFVATPSIRANWPVKTTDPASQLPPPDDSEDDSCADGS